MSNQKVSENIALLLRETTEKLLDYVCPVVDTLQGKVEDLEKELDKFKGNISEDLPEEEKIIFTLNHSAFINLTERVKVVELQGKVTSNNKVLDNDLYSAELVLNYRGAIRPPLDTFTGEEVFHISHIKGQLPNGKTLDAEDIEALFFTFSED